MNEQLTYNAVSPIAKICKPGKRGVEIKVMPLIIILILLTHLQVLLSVSATLVSVGLEVLVS